MNELIAICVFAFLTFAFAVVEITQVCEDAMKYASLREEVEREDDEMSGGYFNYKDEDLRHEVFGWRDTPFNALEDREISELLWDMLDLLHDFDWYQSGDTEKKSYLDAKAAFKKKWFGNRPARIRRIIDETVDEVRNELYELVGVSDADK